MIKVGLTGGIGSGKTFVSKIFKLLGAPVYNSDIEAKKLYTNNIIVKEKIISNFGSQIYFENGELNKQKLSEVIFSDKKSLQIINSIIHPAVKENFEMWLKTVKFPYIIKEAAILFESGAYKYVDKIILVTAPEHKRIERVIKRDNLDEKSVKERINNQLNQSELRKRSDFEIINDEKEMVLDQIIKIHNILMLKSK
ncbi:MAG: dephospho-CoA kinase [Bacteroidales bacterium]|nr:dephospho-CoA kinase [Bacteroidales bacterium]MBN2757085.1 dephospho-CoA kinase [Bacteroidales bacterium]